MELIKMKTVQTNKRYVQTLNESIEVARERQKVLTGIKTPVNGLALVPVDNSYNANNGKVWAR